LIRSLSAWYGILSVQTTVPVILRNVPIITDAVAEASAARIQIAAICRQIGIAKTNTDFSNTFPYL